MGYFFEIRREGEKLGPKRAIAIIYVFHTFVLKSKKNKNMKRKIMFVLASLLIGCSVCFAAPEVQTKKIKYASNAYYEGEVLKKTPQGKGKVIINEDYKNRIEITGQFNDVEVTEGEVAFVIPGVTYKGSLSIEKKIEMLLVIPMVKLEVQLKTGGFYNSKGEFLGILAEPLEILIDCSVSNADMGEVSGKLLVAEDINQDYLKSADLFIGTSDKKLVNASVQNFTLNYAKFTLGRVKKSDKEPYYEYENGVVLPIKLSEKNELKRANGDFIVIDKDLAVLDNKIVLSNTTCLKDSINVKFANGNTFEGKLSSESYNFVNLVTISRYGLVWEDFCMCAGKGKLTYSDGSYYVGNFTDKCAIANGKLVDDSYLVGKLYNASGTIIKAFYGGLTEEEYLKQEAERKAQAEKEEAERIAKEAERKAAYEKSKASDYYKFDENAEISEFVITYPDLSKHEYLRKGNEVVKNKITYADGRIAKLPFKWSNSDYSQLSKFTVAYEFNPRTNFYECTYPDGFKIKHASYYDARKGGIVGGMGNGYFIYEEPKQENGDYAQLVGINDVYDKTGPVLSLEKFRKTFDEYTIVWDSVEYVEFKDGTKFKGKFEYVVEGPSKLAENPHIKELVLKVESALDNVTGAKLIDGEVYTKAGDVVGIYRNGEKKEGFDFDVELAKINAKIAAHKAELEKERLEKEKEKQFQEELNAKYGKRYVDLASHGKLEVGMPFELVKMIAASRLWGLKVSSKYDDTTVYDISTVNGRTLEKIDLGYIRVSKGKIEKVHWW